MPSLIETLNNHRDLTPDQIVAKIRIPRWIYYNTMTLEQYQYLDQFEDHIWVYRYDGEWRKTPIQPHQLIHWPRGYETTMEHYLGSHYHMLPAQDYEHGVTPYPDFERP